MNDIAPVRIDLTTKESRTRLAKLLTNLFDKWNLTGEEQLSLLGMSLSNKRQLSRLRQGSPLPNTRDMFDRAGWLLAVHKTLRLLHPRNAELRYSWVKRRNKDFDNFTPLDVMIREGMIGLFKVLRYLEIDLD